MLPCLPIFGYSCLESTLVASALRRTAVETTSSKLPSQWKRTAHLLLEDDVFLLLCRLEAISPSIRCHEIEHLLNTGVAFPGRGVAVGYAMKSLLLLPNCPIAHLQLFSLSFRPHAPPPADHFRRPQRYDPTNNCNRLWHLIHQKQHNKPN